MTTRAPNIEEHPDLMAMRARSERAYATPMAQAVEALAILAGLYLAASPWIVGFTGFNTLTVTNLIAGLALALLAVGFGSAYERTHGMSWAAAGVGIWAIIAPWVVAGNADTTSTIWSNVVAGGVAALCALVMAGIGTSGGRRR